MRANLVLLLLACGGCLITHAYQIPNVKLQALVNGFRVSIPDEPGIENVAFNINRNRPFLGFEQGEYTAHLSQPIDNRWTYEGKRALKDDDILYVWTNVQHNRRIYRHMAETITVGAAKQPAGGSSGVNETYESSDGNNRTETPPANITPSSGTTKCLPSKTILQNRRVCKDELIFEDNFDNHLNSSLWRHEVRLPLEAGDAEFVLYDTNAIVENGLLTITPVLWNDDKPGTNIKHGHLDLGTRCTSIHNRALECERQPFGAVVLPPIVSARINTKHSFNFKYGRVEIRAKLPQGDWLFPLLLLEPLHNRYGQDAYISGEMRIAFVRGNIELLTRNDQSIDGSTLYGGAVLAPDAAVRESSMAKIQRSVHFGEDFHVYSLTWDERQLSLAVDGHNYGTVQGGFSSVYTNDLTRSNAWKGGTFMAPLDQEFFITLGVSAGGHGDFPNECLNKPWVNTSPKAEYTFWRDRSNWKTTWISPALQVDYVRVYAI